jgi:hypothetical protein
MRIFRPKNMPKPLIALVALVALLVVFISPTRAQTTIWLVDQTSINCGDYQGAIPYCTVQAALTYAQPNDTIRLANGPYRENIVLEAGRSVTLIGDGNALGTANSAVITVAAAAQLTVENLVLSDGTGVRGGGVYNAGTLIMRDSVVTGNSAESGGGIWNEGGTLTLTNVTISANTATANGGGLAFASGNVTLSGVILEGNQAGDGGGLWYGGAGDLALSNLTIRDNVAGGNGGGITIQAIEVANLPQSVTLLDAPSEALRMRSRLRRQSVTSGSIGNQIWLDDNEDGTFQADQELGIGGVTVDLVSDLNADGIAGSDEAIIATVTSAGDGSYRFDALPLDAAYVVVLTDSNRALTNLMPTSTSSSPYAVALSAVAPSDTTANFGFKAGAAQVTIANMTMSGNQAGNGGALWVESGVVSAESLTLSGNKASGNGGGAGVGGGTLRINGGTFSNNEAARNGGGTYSENGILIVRNATFDANMARNGGAVWHNSGLALMAGNTLTNHNVTGNGGALGVEQGVLSVVAGGITDNSADGSGGGCYSTGSGLHLARLSVLRNAAGRGGGVAVGQSGAATFLSVTLSDNEALDEGGGLWNAGSAYLEQSAVSANNAKNAGGGIRNYGTLVLDSTPVKNNETEEVGGGIANGAFSDGGTVIIGASEVAENVARVGGGIYNEGSVWQAQLNGQPIAAVANAHKLLYRFFRLLGEGTYGVVNLTGTSVVDNEATESGGGIYNEQGQLNTNFAEVNDNTARLYGGGIVNSGMADLNRTIVVGNQADGYGGGIVNSGGMVLTDSIVGNNVAGGPGGGILNLGLFNLKGNLIAFNLGAGGADCMALSPITVYGENTIQEQDGCKAVRALGDVE